MLSIHTDSSICSIIHSSSPFIRKTNSANYLFDHRDEKKVDFARNGYTTECINLDEKRRAGELSVDRGSGFLFFEASIKGCCRLLRETFLSLSLSLSLSLPFAGRLQKFQYIKCSLSRRGEEGIQEAWEGVERGSRGWLGNNDNPSRCASISSRRMPHIFADTNDATSRTNTCLVVLRSSVTRSPSPPWDFFSLSLSFFSLFSPSLPFSRNNTLPLTGGHYFSLHNVNRWLRVNVDGNP